MNEITIQQAKLADAPTIHRLAHETWWPTYRGYIPHGQIKLMLELIYSETALQEQMRNGQCFSIATRGDNAVGFIGFRSKPSDPHTMRIEKIYVHPSEQGKGTGKHLIDHVAQAAHAIGGDCLELNVNRNNPAKTFYQKLGFNVVEELDTPFHGYVLNDYVMRKSLVK